MEKRLKYYNEVQIMWNGMEQISRTNGSVSVEPADVSVGQDITAKVTYTVGEDPIFIGGVVRFTIPFGFLPPQIDMPIYPGYTTARTSRKNASVSTFLVENDWWKRGPDRKKTENVCEHVGTHVWVRVLGHALEQGDQIILTYGDTSYHHQAAGRTCRVAGPVQFDAATDQRGTLEAHYSGYYLTSNPPIMTIHPGRAVSFEAILPSELERDVPGEISVLAVDCFHNLATGHTGELECHMGEKLIYQGSFEPWECGVKKIQFVPSETGTLRISVADGQGGKEIWSNPAVVLDKLEGPRHFWGDLHGHTGIQWGRGSGRSYYEFAREVAQVDFCALTDPDAGRYTNNNETAMNSLSCYMTDEQWRGIQEVNRQFYEPGRFVPLLGYEYHNDAPDPEFGGDRNVYYESYDEPIRRCVDEGSYTPEQLWQQIRDQKDRAITVPHHTAKKVMLGSWDLHDEEFQRLVEIYSSWGSSEGAGCEFPIIGGSIYENHSVQHALEKGYRLGFVTGSDSHAGTPGYAYWVFPSDLESYRGGLTCVLTDRLDRKSVFDALWNRRVYATTGERILLDVSLNGVGMGQELPLAEHPVRHLTVKVSGTGEIDRVEVISMGHTVYRHMGSGTELEFTFTDSSVPEHGWLYYYVRVHQKTKAMAWSSPIWVS